MPSLTDKQLKKMLDVIQSVDLAKAKKLQELGWSPPAPGASPEEIFQSYTELLHAQAKLRNVNIPQQGAGSAADMRDKYKQRLNDVLSTRGTPQQEAPIQQPPGQESPGPQMPQPVSSDSDIDAELARLYIELYGKESDRDLPAERQTSVDGRIKYLTKALKKPLSYNDRTVINERMEELKARRVELKQRVHSLEQSKKLKGWTGRSVPTQPQPVKQEQKPAVTAPPAPAVTAPSPSQTSSAPAPVAKSPDPSQRVPPLPPLSQRKTIKSKSFPMADQVAAADALKQVVNHISDNPAYVNTYPIFESVLQRVVNGAPDMYKMIPKIRGAFEYMSQKHPRLFKQIGRLMLDIERGIAPPKQDKKLDVFQRLREFLDPEEPEVFEEPERIFRGSKTYSLDRIIDAVSGYVTELEKSDYPEADIKIAVLRQFGPGVYNSIYDSKVSTSGSGVDADTLAAISWCAAPTRIKSIDKSGNIHAMVTVSDLEREVIVPETIEYHNIIGD